MTDATIWQQFSQEELDRTVRLMIQLRLIQRRRVWILVQGKRLLYVRGSVEAAWQYKITRPGELVLAVLQLFTRLRLLRE